MAPFSYPLVVLSTTLALDFSEEKEYLMSVLRALDVVRNRHIASTAVPGLMAKPTIDILLEVAALSDLQLLQEIMIELNYIDSPQANKPAPHMMFLKG